MNNIALLIIDPQNDFCDLPNAALPVTGANNDMLRLAQWITQHGNTLSSITVTLDSHHVYDIAHPSFWVNPEGNHPSPYTPVSLAEVEQGLWKPVDSTQQTAVIQYLRSTPLFIWPEHCLVGTWGHNIHQELNGVLQQWERTQRKACHMLFKGLNPYTEHFSAFEADMPLQHDPETCFSTQRIPQLITADTIVIAGEALSHCVASSVRSLISHLGPDIATKMIVLRDCTSAVPGFEPKGDEFIEEITGLGARLSTTQQLVKELAH